MLVANRSGTYSVNASNLNVNVRLCPGESFQNQLQVAYCSAVLIASDTIATAGHCVRDVGKNNRVPALSDMRIVFGFRAETSSDPGSREYDADHVFEVNAILNSSADQDWALLKLSKPVPAAVARPIPSIATTRIKTREPVYVVGYPSGLPVKYADGAEVKVNDGAVNFIANLDTFRGNSGSGVFAKASNALVGLLIGGATDYYADGTVADGCFRAYRCLKPACGGEVVTRIEIMKMR
jgi:V8-like Glu-specific endopeptidase